MRFRSDQSRPRKGPLGQLPVDRHPRAAEEGGGQGQGETREPQGLVVPEAHARGAQHERGHEDHVQEGSHVRNRVQTSETTGHGQVRREAEAEHGGEAQRSEANRSHAAHESLAECALLGRAERDVGPGGSRVRRGAQADLRATASLPSRAANVSSSRRGATPVSAVTMRSSFGKNRTAVKGRFHQPVAMQ